MCVSVNTEVNTHGYIDTCAKFCTHSKKWAVCLRQVCLCENQHRGQILKALFCTHVSSLCIETDAVRADRLPAFGRADRFPTPSVIRFGIDLQRWVPPGRGVKTAR